VSQLELKVHEAIASVDDPEYPGISIVDLGLLENIEIGPTGSVIIGLIPTFGGCPALSMIASDVQESVSEVPGVSSALVRWLKAPVWSVDRVSADARAVMAQEFTVAVKIGSEQPLCPRCGGPIRELSMFGPSRCRSVSRCDACSESIEVMRS
jgi:ring-1,2-phenylacetyl-CoA epoxidase subunit PaaD